MPSLPRGVCSVCGKSVPLRRSGVTREHEVAKAPAPWLTLGICPGSGLLPETEPSDNTHNPLT